MKLLPARRSGPDREVAPLELFFDLVYAFAVSELSRHLVVRLGGRGGLETAVLTLAVIYAWFMVAWATNWLDPDRPAVRALLIWAMFVSLVMSATVNGAFADRGWLFVAAC